MIPCCMCGEDAICLEESTEDFYCGDCAWEAYRRKSGKTGRGRDLHLFLWGLLCLAAFLTALSLLVREVSRGG